MPFVNVKTTVKMDQDQTQKLRDAIRSSISLIPQKNENNMMLQIESGCDMWFGDLNKPCAYVEIKLYGPSPREAKQAFVDAVMEALAPLGLSPDRVYMHIDQHDSWVVGNTMLG